MEGSLASVEDGAVGSDAFVSPVGCSPVVMSQERTLSSVSLKMIVIVEFASVISYLTSEPPLPASPFSLYSVKVSQAPWASVTLKPPSPTGRSV